MKKHGPLLLSSLLLVGLIGLMIYLDASRTHGHFYYPVDDTYIHMAIAKSLALHGVWGPTQYHFASSSSSILYPVVLAGTYLLFGVQEISPLALGIISTLLVLVAIHRCLLRFEVGPGLRFACLALVIVAVPLPATALLGMEHGFQLLTVIGLASYGAELIALPDAPTFRQALILCLIGALAEGFRYEAAFLALFVMVCLAARRRWVACGALGAGVAAPIVCLGVVSMHFGWPWLPVSVLLKGNTPHTGSAGAVYFSLGGHALGVLVQNPLLLLLTVLSLALVVTLRIRKFPWTKPAAFLPACFAATCLMHLQFAGVGWFMRYEMYLVGFGVVAITVALNELQRSTSPGRKAQWAPALITLALVGVPIWQRFTRGFEGYVLSGRDRWQISIRPALFIKRYYDRSTVAINDLGAVSYFTDAHVVDIFGLGDLEPLMLRRQSGGYSKEAAAKWLATRGIDVAVIETDWSQVMNWIPDSWNREGEIHVASSPIFFVYKDVGFYSVPPAQVGVMKRNLEQFNRDVPSW